MAAIDVPFSIISSLCPSNSTKYALSSNPLHSIKLHIPFQTRHACIKYASCSVSPFQNHLIRRPNFRVWSVAEVVDVEELTKETQKNDQNSQRRKLFVLNLPWSMTVADIKKLFGECGTVVDVEKIKQKDGQTRGFVFVTMASGEEAQAVVEKFDSHELLGRVVRVEFAKRLKKPPKASPKDFSRGETRHKLYLSNLAWKVRSNDLKEFFSAYNPVSARVVFDSPSGNSAGYGFISFATKEEAEAAIAALDGKELMSRPVRLKFSEKTVGESGNGIEQTTENIVVSEDEVEETSEGKDQGS